MKPLPFAGRFVKAIQTRLMQPKPQYAFIITCDNPHAFAAETLRRTILFGVMHKRFRLGIPATQTPAFGTYPKISLRVQVEGEDRIAEQRCRVLGIMFELNKLVAVVSIETILGSKPHETGLILHGGGHGCLGKPIFERQ